MLFETVHCNENKKAIILFLNENRNVNVISLLHIRIPLFVLVFLMKLSAFFKNNYIAVTLFLACVCDKTVTKILSVLKSNINMQR